MIGYSKNNKVLPIESLKFLNIFHRKKKDLKGKQSRTA